MINIDEAKAKIQKETRTYIVGAKFEQENLKKFELQIEP